MSDITDVIDNAARDYSVSGDAMRWTPEPPSLPCIPGVWPLPNQVVVRFELDVEPFAAAMKRGARLTWCVLDETRATEDAKRERMRRLHIAYRAKRGKR